MDLDNILDDAPSPEANLIINQPIRDFLSESARWAKFLAIVGFVFLGLAVLGVLIGGSTIMTLSGMAGFGALGMIFYLGLLGVSAIPIYYLYNFATKT